MDHQEIGDLAKRAIVSLTDSSLPSEKRNISTPTIRIPETEDECRALEAWAKSTTSDPARASIEQISRHLEFLAATLPSKNVDEHTGKLRFAVYYRMLGGYSDAALSFMSRKVCEQFDWFPTPHQCLEILSEYRAPTSPQGLALSYCAQFWNGKLDDFLSALSDRRCTEEMVDAVPDRWRRIATEQGYLRWDEGKHVIRKPYLMDAYLDQQG
jgi:hypothetical protein